MCFLKLQSCKLSCPLQISFTLTNWSFWNFCTFSSFSCANITFWCYPLLTTCILCVCVCVGCVIESCICASMEGMGPSEGFQPRPKIVGDWEDYWRDVEGPEWWGETGLPQWVWSWKSKTLWTNFLSLINVYIYISISLSLYKYISFATLITNGIAQPFIWFFSPIGRLSTTILWRLTTIRLPIWPMLMLRTGLRQPWRRKADSARVVWTKESLTWAFSLLKTLMVTASIKKHTLTYFLAHQTFTD